MISLRRELLKAEAAFWMSRMHVNSVNLWMTMIGWSAGSGFGRWVPSARLAWLCVFVTLITAALQIVNDVLDADGDRVTAPYLPIPAGLLNVRAAYTWSATYFTGALVALYLCALSLTSIIVVLGLAVAGGLLVLAYSRVKSQGLMGSVVIALPLTLPLVWAWLLAGHQHNLLFTLLFGYSLLTFIAGNIIAALRDVDLDGQVGNDTLPVQVGGPRAFRTCVYAASSAWLMVPVICWQTPHTGWGLILALPGLAVLAFSYLPVLATLQRPGRGRVQRLRDLYPVQMSEHLRHLAVLAALHPALSLAAAVALNLFTWSGSRLYARRLISGSLQRSLTSLYGAPAGPPQTAARQPALPT